MKILTWNVYRHNSQLSGLFEKAKHTGADILCFQEVPETNISMLEDCFQGFNLFKSRQFFIKKKVERSIYLYNVVVSRYPFVSCFSVPHKRIGLKSPPRYKVNYSDLQLEFTVIDIVVEGIGAVRMFNLHLECVAPPSVRLARLRQASELFMADSVNIVAGDFNSFLNPFLSPFVAGLFGNFRVSDFFCFERQAIALACAEMGLQNPFKGTSSFKYSPGQYDYILIPNDRNYRTKERLKGLFGSDHYGLYLEIERGMEVA